MSILWEYTFSKEICEKTLLICMIFLFLCGTFMSVDMNVSVDLIWSIAALILKYEEYFLEGFLLLS